MAGRNLLNLESVSKAFDIRPLLENVSLGINEAERIGVVGRNGGGKSTLLKVIRQFQKQKPLQKEKALVEELFEESLSKIALLLLW